jgi:hypothetical protein
MGLIRLQHGIELGTAYSSESAGLRYILNLGGHRQQAESGLDQLFSTAHKRSLPVELDCPPPTAAVQITSTI